MSAPESKGGNMNSSFSFREGKWKVSWPERVSQQDIVCLSPPLDPMQGLPLGNGDMGALVWCEPQRLVLAVNKCDLWDDSPDTKTGGFNEDAPYWEDRWGTLRHACRVEIDLGMPFMDSWYLNDFEARLDLARAMVLIRSVTPFGSFEARVFVSSGSKVLTIDYKIQAKEPVSPRVLVKRWGSRTFAHYYSQINRDSSIGLSGTDIILGEDNLILTQQLNRMNFAVAVCVQSNGTDVTPRRNHSRSGVFESPAAESHCSQVFLTVANSEETAEPAKEGKRLLVTAKKKGVLSIEKAHGQAWREFWECLFVQIEDKFLENIWYLTIYYAGSSQRGRYPALFNEALWGWNRDFQQWCHYFHWNQQMLTWPLPSANHPELMKPYLNYRFSMLEKAKETAAQLGKEGAFYTDCADRLGYQGVDNNRTPGGQIADDFWRYYQYSGDIELLREQGWPVISEVARWHYGTLEKKSDGLYHTTPAWGYEGGNMLKDCVTELVTTKKVFEIALETARLLDIKSPELAVWKEALTHLAPLVTMESPVNPGVEIFAGGLQKGIEKDAGKAFCGGFKTGDDEEWENPQPTCQHDPKRWGQIFSAASTSMVFPSGSIGLKDKGTRNFEIALATVRESSKHWIGDIVRARMGMREELQKELESKLKEDLTPTGFWFFSPGFWDISQVADPMLAPKNFKQKDVDGPEWEAFMKSKSPFRAWECRHVQQEGPYLVATAISESLLQSYDGVIRVAPATAPGSPFAFTLLASGGFLVSCQGVGEKVDWIHIYSQRGGVCRVANPWSGKKVFYHTVGSDLWQEFSGTELSFSAEPGKMYLLAEEKWDLAAPWTTRELSPEVNKGPRYSADRKVMLGIPRMLLTS